MKTKRGCQAAVKKHLANAAVLCVALVLAPAVIEVGVRLLRPQPDIAEWFRQDDRYGFALKPDFRQAYHYGTHDFVMHVQTNAQGFREPAPEAAGEAGIPSILLLGDSFVFGYGINVEDRFDIHLRKGFEAEGRPVRTINAGVPGWGTQNEVRYALDHLDDHAARVVVLAFCANDPANDRGADRPALPDVKSPLYAPKMFLRLHSHTYRLLLKLRALRRHDAKLENDMADGGQGRLDLQSASIISEEQWQRTLSTIRSFHQELNKANGHVALILLATAPDNQDIRLHLSSLDNAGHLRYLDLAPALAAVSPAERRTPWDGHWSPGVHRIVGRELHDFISQNGLLQGKP